MNRETNSRIIKFSKNVKYVPALKRIYIGHYNLNLHCLFPTFLFQVIELYFLFNIIYPYTPQSKKVKKNYILFIIFYSLLIFSFWLNIIVGPGYLPFYYFQKEKKKPNKLGNRKDEVLNNRDMNDFEDLEIINNNEICGNELGIAISDEDFKIVNSTLMINLSSNITYFLSYLSFFKLPPIISSHQPPFAEYLVSEHRFVMMPLIYDNFTGTWVGKKNAKLFLLYRFFSSISSLIIIFSFLDILVYFVEDYCFGTYFLGCMCISILFLIKAFFQIVLCLRVINKIAFTKFTRLGNVNNERDCVDEEELSFTPNEVYKNIKNYLGDNIFLWGLPIPSFRGFSDDELYAMQRKKFLFS